MKLRFQKGSAYMMTIFMVVFFSILVVAILMTSTQSATLQNNSHQMMAAQYAAEAGAKIGLQIAVSQIWDYNFIHKTDPMNAFGTADILSDPVTLFDGSNARFRYLIKKVFVPALPSPTPASLPWGNLRIIRIISHGQVTTNGRTYDRYAVVDVNIEGTVTAASSIANYLNGATFSGHDWPTDMSTTPPSVIPPDSDFYNQVMFNDPSLIMQSNNFTEAFNCADEVYDDYYNMTGYGIYYGMTGTANNPDGYIVHFDPGAKNPPYAPNGMFLVKRIKANSDPTLAGTWNRAGHNEWDDSKNSYYYAPENTGTPTGGWVPFEPNSIPIPTTYTPGDAAFDSAFVDNNNNITGVPLDFLKSYVFEKSGHTLANESMEDFSRARHTIRIAVSDDDGPTGSHKPVHEIYFDGIRILHFTDNNTNHPPIMDFRNTHFGLRVWNCKSRFYNAVPVKNAFTWWKYDYANPAKFGTIDFPPTP